MIFILETPINVHPSNGEVYNGNGNFQFQFTGDKISVIQGHMYEIDNSKEIMNWYCNHNIDAVNKTVITTHPSISEYCTKGRDYKYNYCIYQKNPQIDCNKIIKGQLKSFESYIYYDYYIDLNAFSNLSDIILYSNALTSGSLLTLYNENKTRTLTLHVQYFISQIQLQPDKNDDQNKVVSNLIRVAEPIGNFADLNQYTHFEFSKFNPYTPLCDIYIGTGYLGSEIVGANSGHFGSVDAYLQDDIFNSEYESVTYKGYQLNSVFIEIGKVRRRVLNYQKIDAGGHPSGLISYQGFFSKNFLNKYKNANGNVPFKIYCNYIKTPWYDFKYRSAPSTGYLETNLSSSGLKCSTTYNQAENVSLKSYEYEVYSNEEEIIIDITDEQPIEIHSLLYGKISIKLPISLNEYDNILNGNIDLYVNGVLSSSAPISLYDRATNTVITEKRTSMTVDEIKTSITKIIIKLNKKYLYTSGTKYSYDLTHNFQIPAATSDYLIRSKITTQENDTINSTTSVYCNPDKIPDEYIVDTENDIRCLPTITKRGSALWAAIMPYSTIGSIALVIETGNVYILGSNGWSLCSEFIQKKG